MTPLGPVSTHLEASLRGRVRRHGIVVWLDLDGDYTRFVDALAERAGRGDLPYAVHGFRGSFLELMLALEHQAGGVEKTPLLLHLPGFNEDAVRSTPLFELYSAGVRYRYKLDTLVTEAATGQVRPDQIEASREAGLSTLEEADAWLAALLDEPAAGGLRARLRDRGLQGVVDDLVEGRGVARGLGSADDRAVIEEQLASWSGLPRPWRDRAMPGGPAGAHDLAFAVASWALAVEYAHDLQRKPVDPQLVSSLKLPVGVVKACGALAAHLRERHATFYRRTADETEGWLADEVEVARAEDLGRVDTFRFEEDLVLEAALAALADERWEVVARWAGDRVAEGGSFWAAEDPARRLAWQLLQDAAALGEALVRAGPALRARDLPHALARYTEVGAAVDRAHRLLEQRRVSALDPQLPRFEVLRARLDGLRELWRRWADDWARDFNALCRQQGFLPPAELQQRTLFDQVVRPLTQKPGPTALFLVDALRFEMADELLQAIGGTPATTVHLRARFAELPTVTAMGMNALAPVAQGGRLRPAMAGGKIKGLASGEFRVHNPETRNRAMWDRVGGDTCPLLTLDEVVERDASSLKRAVSRARLVVVHSLEIDNAGEKGVGRRVFEGVLRTLRAAWRLLREAGVRRFVFTSDHGFLLLDDSALRAQTHGRKVDPERRHVVSTVGADHTNEVRVPLAELGYEDVDGLHLHFPESTAVFDRGKKPSPFVHGGNSPQERVIPVLTVEHRGAAGGHTVRYEVSAQAEREVAGMHCLKARVRVADQGALAFGGTEEVELALRVVDEVVASVEVCDVQGGARDLGGEIRASVGQDFELVFKLLGPTEARVRLELYHPGAEADVRPCVLETRFVVTGESPEPEEACDVRFLEDLPPGGVRQVFEHLAAHGAVTESEAATMLGGPRALRRFSARFEEYSAKASFDIRIDTIGGVKRYVREGSKQ